MGRVSGLLGMPVVVEKYLVYFITIYVMLCSNTFRRKSQQDKVLVNRPSTTFLIIALDYNIYMTISGFNIKHVFYASMYYKSNKHKTRIGDRNLRPDEKRKYIDSCSFFFLTDFQKKIIHDPRTKNQ